ncbi:MAG: nucleotidyltransferase domain-containing protein [Candidatus Stahlbacteria bacterium]|nr:nucleotidyltransferase domain-containing protein [Candidatus Stahlbacteria bacterium]
MAKREIIEISKILQELLQQRKVSIYKIIIFGSYAKGSQRKDSDIDIIVVSNDFRNKDIFERVKLTSGVHRGLVDRIKKPFDIMYYSDTEWDEGDSLIINSAKEDGEIIYG